MSSSHLVAAGLVAFTLSKPIGSARARVQRTLYAQPLKREGPLPTFSGLASRLHCRQDGIISLRRLPSGTWPSQGRQKIADKEQHQKQQ